MNNLKKELSLLSPLLKGDIETNEAHCLLYATDASVYREIPVAVVRPVGTDDITRIIRFANENKVPLIPRAAGTSLAGQVVGKGIIVDVSKYMTCILEINADKRWVRVQPGVVLDELNKHLASYGLFFGPETSTSSRCMIGGMMGNNSCGARSLVYGNTRRHIISVNAVLSDGSEVEFGPLSEKEFHKKCSGSSLENNIYRTIREILSEPSNIEEIQKEYPDKNLYRRNTGYAIDLLAENLPFNPSGEPFNFCKLLTGSEGTLAFITEIKLNLVPLPPTETALVCAHFESISQAIRANLIALKYHPYSVELIDHVILDCTKDNIEQQKNRFFLKGEPQAILIIEFFADTREEIILKEKNMEQEMRASGLGYHFPLISGQDIKRVLSLRKAGLGLMSNIPGDKKPVAVIEDTAVPVEHLERYIEEFRTLLTQYGLDCVYYAHIGSGELHLKPVLDLKNKKDVELFRTIALEVAKLVKKYHGSLSGEHGDGRLRGEFIPLMIGEKNYRLLRQIKEVWDPNSIFNPGKIIDTPPMNTSLRFEPGQTTRDINTLFDFSKSQGIVRATEQCSGSADCRKSSLIGGVMCPSYMATFDEKNSTRARANILREFLTRSEKKNPFNHQELYNIMDLCLSCKGCKSECPSSVDMTKLKAEFLQHYYDSNSIPLRTRLVGYLPRLNRLGSMAPGLYNFFISGSVFSSIIKTWLGFAKERNIPLLYKTSLRKWMKQNPELLVSKNNSQGKVYLLVDEFTNYNDTETGIKAVMLLSILGWTVEPVKINESGRTYLSKGMVRKAQKIVRHNIPILYSMISPETPLIGIEPSAVLTLRDEYIDLAGDELRETAGKIASSVFLIDEFLAEQMEKGKIKKDVFSSEKKIIKLHGHCHQKSLASTLPTKKMLSFPANYIVEEIPSGCCGMAGSFGFETEHYELSVKIGELVLFPEIRKISSHVLIAAPGTSCRQQILDGTGRKSYHPVEILFDALKK